MSEAVIHIPMMPPKECSPNFHGSWKDKARAVRDFRAAAGWAAIESRMFWEGSGFVVMDVEIAWIGRRKVLDDDNAWASLKAARDGIADVLFGGEDRFITQGTLTQTRGDGTVTVTLRAL